MVCYSASASGLDGHIGQIVEGNSVAGSEPPILGDGTDSLHSTKSSKSAILSRFLTRLLDPVIPVKLSRSMPTLSNSSSKSALISDGELMRKEAYINDGWLLDNRIALTPGRKYDIAALIVDSDAILASQLKKGRLCPRESVSQQCVDVNDSISRLDLREESTFGNYFYLVVLMLAAHGFLCLLSCVAPSWLPPLFRAPTRR